MGGPDEDGVSDVGPGRVVAAHQEAVSVCPLWDLSKNLPQNNHVAETGYQVAAVSGTAFHEYFSES